MLKPYNPLQSGLVIGNNGTTRLAGVVQRKRPHIHTLLNDAHYILHKELARLACLVEEGGLSAKDANAFSKYAEILAKLAKEERAQDEEDSPEKLSEEELVSKAKQLLSENE